MAGRILAIDFGTKRIGVAVSDGLGLTAQGLPTVQRTRTRDDLRRIRELAEELGVVRIIVGNPIRYDGTETEMSRRVAAFAERVRRRVSCPVELWDERLTSVEANRVLRASGMGIEKRRRAADRVAATLLLQSYLDYLAFQTRREQPTGAGSC